MIKIIKKIISFFTWKCPYRKECPFYDKNSSVCNDSTAENGYCGQYREFNKKLLTNN